MSVKSAVWSPTRSGVWVPTSTPGGAPAVNPLSQLTEGLLFKDDFSGDLSLWDTSGGTSAIVGGQVQVNSWGRLKLPITTVAARNKSYAQCQMTRSGTGDGAFELRWNADIDAYYMGYLEGSTTLFRVSNTSYTNLDNSGLGNPDNVQKLAALYVADNDQRSWRDGAVRAVETDAALNGQDGILVLWARTSGSCLFDDVIYMSDKIVTCTGLEASQKFKILTSGEAVVGTATESGGTATLDLGGDEVPYDGWPTAIVTDNLDVELYRLSGAFYPGSTFQLDIPVYPTVTGTQEFRLDAGSLGALDSQIGSWVDIWSGYDFTKNTSANALVKDSVFTSPRKHVLWNGSQTDMLNADRGASTGLGPITVFIVLKTGVISGAPGHSTMVQFSSPIATNRMSFGARRNAANNRLYWWDTNGGWLETSTTLADNTKYLISYRSNNTFMNIAVDDGAEEDVGNPVLQQLETYNVGGTQANTEPFIGSIAAVIFYRTALSDADRILVRDYLNTRYGVY